MKENLFFKLNNEIYIPKISINAKTPIRKRNKGKNFYYKRGSSKYFCFLQERFSDFYCLIIKSVLYPKFIDGFKEENLIKTDKDILEIKKFLKNESIKKRKYITFSLNSIKIQINY